MDNSLYPKLDSKISEDQIPKTQGSKKRKISEETDLLKKKISEKTVVRVKIEENENDKQKSEGPPPSDCWSWRKYGQKPIKGSPYPRGYYRCSSSKGCSAKKQVERCRTDASFFIITYTCTHDHSSAKEPKQETPKIPKEEDLKEKDEKGQESLNGASENITDFHYSQSPFNSPSHQDIIIDLKQEEESPFTENLQNVLFDEVEKPCCYSNPLTFSTPKSEENDLYDFSTPKSDENDFYDELGELPMSSSSSFTRSNFVEDRIIILPS